LVNDLCEPGQTLERAHALAARIVANAPLAVRKSREISLASVDAADEVGWKLSAESMNALAQTEDFWEGPKAFIEKRDPVWKGR
jgi:enoyl-CoA hydratase